MPLLSIFKMDEKFKLEVDEWIKKLNSDVREIPDIKKTLIEIIDNVQHNYELIYEMKNEIEYLKKEISSLKIIQIVMLNNNDKENLKNLNSFDIIKLKGFLG